jgi:C-3',4' desaturase CrtD
MFDVAIIGAGIAGMATAARLQARGFSTIVLEAHSHPGGCAGYFRRRGFAFDVGATTLVDFEPGGVGGELMDSIGMPPMQGEALPGYVAWLPDRTVTLYRDHHAWAAERLAVFGDTARHRALWAFLDNLAETFWQASRFGIKLPIRSANDLLRCLRAIDLSCLPLARYLLWTMADALRAFGVRDDQPLCALLAMLVEDTVHSTLEDAPLINAALGITIRGAGLTRHRGGMWGFWRRFAAHYRALGGQLLVACRVTRVEGRKGEFTLYTSRGVFQSAQVVSAIPASVTARIAPAAVGRALQLYLRRDEPALGGASVVFLGVPEEQVACQNFTHHQLMQDYSQPLGNGNNMFVSVSAPGDTESAPPECRAVMISTHCDLEDWDGLQPEAYDARKQAIGARLVKYARRVYPNLGENALVYEVGTPHTYEMFTGRPRGAVGGVRQTMRNANQNAIPYDLGPAGFWMVGDTTWPGLGTVACVLASRIVAEEITRVALRAKQKLLRIRHVVPLHHPGV